MNCRGKAGHVPASSAEVNESYIRGSMHRQSNLITVQQYATYSVLYTWVHASSIEFNNCPTICDLFSLLHFCRQLQKCNKLNKSHLVGQLLNLIMSVAIPLFCPVCAVTTVPLPLSYFEFHINLSKDKHI